jgi:hypothetical protein
MASVNLQLIPMLLGQFYCFSAESASNVASTVVSSSHTTRKFGIFIYPFPYDLTRCSEVFDVTVGPRY